MTINPHGTFESLVEQVRSRLNEPNVASHTNRIKLFICLGIEEHRTERFYWMIAKFRCRLFDDQREYDLRADFDPPLRAIEGGRCWIWEDGSETITHDVMRTDSEDIEDHRTTTQYRGYPRYFATEGGVLTLDPTPSSGDADVLTGRGIKALDPPQRQWDGSAWQFEDDDYTNEWFTEGAEMLDAYVRYKLCAGPLKRTDEAAVALGEYENSLMRMRKETADDDGFESIAPWPRYL